MNNAKNGSHATASNGNRARRVKRAIVGLANEIAVTATAVIASVDLVAIAVKGEIAARASAVAVTDSRRRNGKDQRFVKCIRRQIRRQSLKIRSRVRSASAIRSSPRSPASGVSHADH